MVRDLFRFYRQAPELLERMTGPTLGDYLGQHRYGDAFRDEHLVPMASALWSSPSAQILVVPGALPRAVHGQPPDAAGQRIGRSGASCVVGRSVTSRRFARAGT